MFNKITNKQAVLMAADHIEANPHLFNFMSIRIPKSLDYTGCALGWIGYFLNKNRIFFKMSRFTQVVFVLKERNTLEIYNKITDGYQRTDPTTENWYRNPVLCVKGLRAYAETLK